MAIRRALIDTMYSMAKGRRPTPKTRARDAPKLAAAEMPSVKGLASGLLRIVCIWAPAAERAAPTTTAISATGMRMSQITTQIWVETSGDPARASTTSRMVYRAGPRPRSAIWKHKNDSEPKEHELLRRTARARYRPRPGWTAMAMPRWPRIYSLSLSETQ